MSGQQGESWKSCKQEKTLDLCCAKTTLTAGVEQGQGWGKARAGARPSVGSEEAREGEERQGGGEDKVICSEVELVAH